MVRAPQGRIMRSTTAPTATPPAKEAFWTCARTNLFPLNRAEVAKAVTQEPKSESIVLMTTRSWSIPVDRALLKLGQNSHKNTTASDTLIM